MRRLIVEEPLSRPAKWSPFVAWFALAVTLMAVALIRFQRVDYPAGFTALGIGLGLALLAALLSVLAFLRIWQEGRQGLGSAVPRPPPCDADPRLSGLVRGQGA